MVGNGTLGCPEDARPDGAQRSGPGPEAGDGTAAPRPAARPHRVVFLGGLLLESQIPQIERDSRSVIQYAADALQRALLRGFTLYPDLDVRLVNVPYIGSYPKTYRKAWFPAVTDLLFGKVPVTGMGFFNLLLARDHFRRRAALCGLAPLVRSPGDCVVVVYSAHLPFVRAVMDCRRLNPDLRICVIVPDLIEHMGDYGRLRKILANHNGRVFRRLATQADHFVVLTPHMATELGIGPDRHVVIEGIYDPQAHLPAAPWSPEPAPIFIYTGTLATRYGILDLLDAFSQLDVPSARLWICGMGDAQGAVEDLARRDPRVTYHGQLPRTEVLALQARAHVMVNPRRPEGEFTRYSFPSKTLEYLASARPVIMHWLPGIPEGYRPHLITPDTGDAKGLAQAMRRVAALPQDDLRRIGEAGRDFILMHKTPRAQIGKLLKALYPGGLRAPSDGD